MLLKPNRRDTAVRKLADLRAIAVAAVRHCRLRIDEMVPVVLSPHDAEILAAVADLDDEVRRLCDEALSREANR